MPWKIIDKNNNYWRKARFIKKPFLLKLLFNLVEGQLKQLRHLPYNGWEKFIILTSVGLKFYNFLDIRFD